MLRNTLLDFFDDRIQSSSVFLTYDNGLVTRSFTYNDVRMMALTFAQVLRAAGIRKHDKVVFWGENRPEWVMAFWGCVLEGVIVVPLDYRASVDLFKRVMNIVKARAIVVGDEVVLPTLNESIKIWNFAELVSPNSTFSKQRKSDEHIFQKQKNSVEQSDVVEIIFTSGATADPKGVVITHRNILANIVPVERELTKYSKYGRPFFPVTISESTPLESLVRTVNGYLYSANAPGNCRFHPRI